MAINKVILIGNLGADPEVRYLEGDRVVANFNIATNETYIDKQGNKITQTEWHRIEMWDGLAKVAENYLSKGRQVYIEGKLKTDNWKDKEGNDRYTTKIRTTTLQLLGSSSQENNDDSSNSSAPNKNQASDNQSTEQSNDNQDDDLPF